MAEIVVSVHSPLIPMLKRLAAAGHGLLALHPGFAKQLADLDLPARPLGATLGREDHRIAHEQAAALLAATGTMGDMDGLDPAPAGYMREHLAGFLYPRLGDLTLLMAALQTVQPALVILHNDVEPVTRACALWARAHGVPCLHVPHAIYLPSRDRGRRGEDVHDLVTASHVAVAGSYQADWYRERGAQRVRETGLPQFDIWASLRSDPSRARRLLGLDPHRPVVTLASSWRQDTHLLGHHDGVEEAARVFFDVAAMLDGVEVVVKVHPRGEANGYGVAWHAALAEERGVRCMITDRYLDAVLQATDCLIAYGPSNVILEAAHIHTIRLMSIDGFHDDPEVTTLESGAGKNAFAEAVRDVLAEPPRGAVRLLGHYVGRCDGQAYRRAADWALELVR